MRLRALGPEMDIAGLCRGDGANIGIEFRSAFIAEYPLAPYALSDPSLLAFFMVS